MSIHVCRILTKPVIPIKRKGVCLFMRDGEKRKDGERENNIFNPKKGAHGMTNGHKEKQEDIVRETNKTSNKSNKKQKSRTSSRMMDRWKETLKGS